MNEAYYDGGADEREGFMPPITPYASPMHNFSNSIKEITDPDEEIYKFELGLRGLSLNEKGEIVRVCDPLMNDEGISSVIGILKARVNRNTVMSNLDDYQISNLIDYMGDTLAKDLMLNRVKYDIFNPSSRDKITSGALTTAFICLNRPKEEGERRFWKGSQQEITMRNETAAKNSGGGGLKGLMKNVVGW